MDKITNPLLPIGQKTVLITKYHTSKFVKQVEEPKSLIEFTYFHYKYTLKENKELLSLNASTDWTHLLPYAAH